MPPSEKSAAVPYHTPEPLPSKASLHLYQTTNYCFLLLAESQIYYWQQQQLELVCQQFLDFKPDKLP